MSDTDLTYETARRFSDLCELSAQFLLGESITSPAGHLWEETQPVAAQLAAVNRAGVLTVASQPTVYMDSRGWSQRGYIEGFVESKNETKLRRFFYRQELSLVIYRPRDARIRNNVAEHPSLVVSDFRKHWTPHGLLGDGRETRVDAFLKQSEYRTELRRDLKVASYFVVIDFRWDKPLAVFEAMTAFAKTLTPARKKRR